MENLQQLLKHTGSHYEYFAAVDGEFNGKDGHNTLRNK